MPSDSPNAKVFISYRREDTAAHAGRLYDRLVAHFGEDQIFIDIDQIDFGEDFVDVINRKVGSCEIAIVSIGPNWLTLTDSSGKRRLDDSEDFVRMEIVAALERKIRVIPVLVGGARMPRKQDLPEALAPLSRRNAIELSEMRFHADVSRLIEAIEKPRAFPEQKASPSPAPAAPVEAPATIGVPEPKDPRKAPASPTAPQFSARPVAPVAGGPPSLPARSTKRLAYAGGLFVLLLVGLGLLLYLRSTPQGDRVSIADQPKATPMSAETSSIVPVTPAPFSATARPSATTEQTPVTKPPTSAQPSDAEMLRQMMDLAKPGESHKLLMSLAGTWTYTLKIWTDPTGSPQEFTGTAVRQAILDGRFFSFEVAHKMKLPGTDGKIRDTNFNGLRIEGYDNAKKRFVSSWIDNMGTMIMNSEGTYDAGTRTFTYTSDLEVTPGIMTKVRETTRVVDNDHHTFEYYENRGQGEAKAVEIVYTRKKSAMIEQAPIVTRVANTEPSAADMQKMMELAKPGENHKLLAAMTGSWNYTVKMWMDPKEPPSESRGTATRKAIMDGRFFIADHAGKFQMPDADGKVKDMNFKGMAIEGYDNAKRKFVSAWVDNLGTSIMISEGAYDAATKTFNYTAELEVIPGMKSKLRELIKTPDKDHMSMEYYEDRGQGEAKTMEISYTRSGKK